MPPTATTWVLTTAEANRHIEALTEAMDLLTRRYPDEPTAILYGRLRDLRDVLERGAEETLVPVDHWGRPADLDSILRLRSGHGDGEY